MILAGIDIGTNTLRLLIADTDGSSLRELHGDRRITRLGRGLDRSGALSRGSREESLAALDEFAVDIGRHGAEAVSAVGTSALRNAGNADAFIADVRARAGKPPECALRLEARHSAGVLLITVTDDGKGLDHEAIKRKAIERGLTTKEKAAALAEHQLYDFVTMPGFSTAERVTEVSGRGVGLDVVKNKVEAMGRNQCFFHFPA